MLLYILGLPIRISVGRGVGGVWLRGGPESVSTDSASVPGGSTPTLLLRKRENIFSELLHVEKLQTGPLLTVLSGVIYYGVTVK